MNLTITTKVNTPTVNPRQNKWFWQEWYAVVCTLRNNTLRAEEREWDEASEELSFRTYTASNPIKGN